MRASQRADGGGCRLRPRSTAAASSSLAVVDRFGREGPRLLDAGAGRPAGQHPPPARRMPAFGGAIPTRYTRSVRSVSALDFADRLRRAASRTPAGLEPTCSRRRFLHGATPVGPARRTIHRLSWTRPATNSTRSLTPHPDQLLRCGRCECGSRPPEPSGIGCRINDSDRATSGYAPQPGEAVIARSAAPEPECGMTRAVEMSLAAHAFACGGGFWAGRFLRTIRRSGRVFHTVATPPWEPMPR